MAPERTNPTVPGRQDQDLNDGTMARTLSPRPGSLGAKNVFNSDKNSLDKTSIPSVAQLREISVGSLSKPQNASKLFADPPSVVTDAKLVDGKLKGGHLTPVVQTSQYQVHMFAHALKGAVPNRIAAVVPGGLTEFTRAFIFFHPLPTKAAGYEDADYAEQTGNWKNIYRYCDQQGVQLAASKRKMVFIFPIFNLASTDTCGRFPAEWKSLIEDIMVMLRKSHAPGLADEPRPTITDVVTASFSAGVKYHHTFLTQAKDLGTYLRKVYDYDGRFSSHKDLSEKLNVHSGAKVINYDQHSVKQDEVNKEFTSKNAIHLPDWRWRDLPNKQTSFLDIPLDIAFEAPAKGSKIIHGAIPRFMMYHSLHHCNVG